MNNLKLNALTLMLITSLLANSLNAAVSVDIGFQDGQTLGDKVGKIINDTYQKGVAWVKENIGTPFIAENWNARKNLEANTKKESDSKPDLPNSKSAEAFDEPDQPNESAASIAEKFAAKSESETPSNSSLSNTEKREVFGAKSFDASGEYCGEHDCLNSSNSQIAKNNNSNKPDLSEKQLDKVAEKASESAEKQALESGSSPEEAAKKGAEAGDKAKENAKKQNGETETAENGKVLDKKECTAGLAQKTKNGEIKKGTERQFSFITASKLISKKDKGTAENKIYRVGIKSPIKEADFFIDKSNGGKTNPKFKKESDEKLFCCKISKFDTVTRKKVCVRSDPEKPSDMSGEIPKEEISQLTS